MVVACSENNAIGKDNKMLWNLSDDLKHFKAVTKGHCVIMGKNTFDSIGKPLKGRMNIVLTKNKTYNNVIVCASIE